MKPGRTPKGTQPEPTRYYEEFLLAYLRGRTGDTTLVTLEDGLAAVSLYGLERDVNKFHRKPTLPRVKRVIEILQGLPGLKPVSLVDVGCGRGTALWPMMEALPHTSFTGIDAYEGRSKDLWAMKAAGITQLNVPFHLEAENLEGIGANNFDCATILEVLEHLPEGGPEKAAREVLRVTRRAVVFSVPSVKDYNPDHLRLYTEGQLRNLWLAAGAKRVEIHTDIPKHFVGVAYVEG